MKGGAKKPELAKLLGGIRECKSDQGLQKNTTS